MSNDSINNQDFKALELLFDRRSRFERMAMLYVRDREVARDLMMESFKYFWEHRHEIDLSGNIEAYMYRVVRNKCLDWLQREQLRRRMESTLQSDAEFEIQMRISTLQAFDPDWLFDRELQAHVRRSIAALPEKTRQIFIMSRRDNLTYQEIADKMDVSVKTVEFHISKALRLLHKDLDDTLLLFIFLFMESVA